MVRYGAVGTIGYGYYGTIANNLFSLIPIEKIITKFYYHLLRGGKFQEKLLSLSASTSMPAINFKSLDAIKIPIPSLPEQTQIAEFLSSIDSKLELVVKELLGVKEFKKGLLQQMFV